LRKTQYVIAHFNKYLKTSLSILFSRKGAESLNKLNDITAMRILVTGGAGFIGSNLVGHLLEKGFEDITIYDCLTYAGRLENLEEFAERITFLKKDIRNAADIENAIKDADIVYHLAAASHVDRSITEPETFMTTEFLGTFNILEGCRKHDARLIHVSTCEVYGTAEEIPMGENHPLNPRSPYAASKCGADRLCYSYHITYSLPVTIVRPFNNYGPRQHTEKLIPHFITKALRNKNLPVYGRGEATRDWLYVGDCVEALERMRDAKAYGEAINIAGESERSVLQIAHLILEYTGKPKSLITFVDDRPGNVPRFLGSNEKIGKILKWKPRMNFEEGLRKTVEWYKNNERWWAPLLSN